MPLQDFSLPSITPGLPSYANIIKVLQSPTPNESQFMPEIQNILGQSSEFLKPAIGSLQEDINMGLAGLEGDFARRGLTGSSIEAQGLATARGKGNRAISELVGGFAERGANTFAQILARARQGDVEAARQLQQMIAQAMGQELGAEREMTQFNRGLDFQADQSRQERNAALIRSIIGVGGEAGSAYLRRKR